MDVQIVEHQNEYGSWDGFVVVAPKRGNVRVDRGMEPFKTEAAARKWLAANYPTAVIETGE